MVIKGSAQRLAIISTLIAEYDKTDPMEVIGNTIDSMSRIVNKAIELRRVVDGPRPNFPKGAPDQTAGPAIVGAVSGPEIVQPHTAPVQTAAGAVNGSDPAGTAAATKKAPAAGAKKVTAPATPVVPITAQPLTPEQTAELKEICDFTMDRGGQGHAPAIKAKFAEFGVKKAGELKPEQFNPFRMFLQTLEDKVQDSGLV